MDEQAVELDHEQAHLALAYACLDAMRQRAQLALDHTRRDAALTDAFDTAAIQHNLERRLTALAESRAALAFGRIDEEEGDRWYVGRRHVEDTKGDPVVVDWRTPVAVPFYRATWVDPQGLARRRRFAVEGRVLAGLFDEDFSNPDGRADGGGGGGVPDPLLAELDRARSGEMRDIVATIQAEQDVIIRAPLSDLVVVQGGPGTGKTAVGLHRAAYLLYEHRRELQRTQLLVVGPNKLFLRYIAQVLPSLGETSVHQTTVDGLVAGMFAVRGVDDSEAVLRLKGDARMARVVKRLVEDRIVIPADDVVIPTAYGVITVAAAELAALVTTQMSRNLPTNDSREVLRTLMMQLVWKTYETRSSADPSHSASFHSDLRNRKEFKALLDKLWPTMSAPALIRSLLGKPKAMTSAAQGLLSVEEQQLLRRKSAASVKDERWTRADLALLDEAQARTAGVARVFGHVVVDEAQDLSAMELRMVARRSPKRSMTVLGDLAQATSAAAQTSWDEAITHLEVAGGVRGRVDELELGYRVPAVILEFANRLLTVAAPGVKPSKSVRQSGAAPLVSRVDATLRLAAIAEQATEMAAMWTTVGVVGPEYLLDDILGALTTMGLTAGDARRAASLDESVVVLGAVASKGLEFDAVLVVEPSAIVAERDGGARALYVALTRAVQELRIVHVDDLPEALR